MSHTHKSSTGGHLALDFTNTLSWDRNDPTAGEELPSYQAILDWLLDAGLVSRKTYGVLTARAKENPGDADAVHRKAIDLRAAIHDVFSSFAGASSDPSKRSVELINVLLDSLPLSLRISSTGADWDWSRRLGDLESVLWPLVWSAASLLTSPELSKVKQCAGDRCGWLFVDNSRRHNRKWCDMRHCGNRAKARRHYYRHHT